MNECDKLRILLLEDQPTDARLIVDELKDAGMVFTSLRVETRDSFVSALQEFSPDVVLADYRLPSFDGKEALDITRKTHPEIPVIMVSGTLGDEGAVSFLKSGAKDYVLKDNLVRLPSAVQRVLSAEHGIRARKAAEKALRESERELRLFRDLLDNSMDSIEIIDPVTLRFLDANEAACSNLGYSRDELLSLSMSDIDISFDAESRKRVEQQLLQQGSARFEGMHRRQDGSTYPVEVNLRVVELDRRYMLGIARDITERKESERALARANRALRTLSAGNEVLVRAKSEPELLESACRVIIEKGGYLAAWMLHGKEEMEPVASFGEGCFGEKTGILEKFAKRAAIDAVGKRMTMVISDILADPRFAPWIEVVKACGCRSALAIPVLQNSAVSGAIVISASEVGAFGPEEIALLEELADDLAYGIATLRTRQERDLALEGERIQSSKLSQSLQEMIAAIAMTLEKRDPYTAGHQQKVAQIASLIAAELGLSKEKVNGIHLGALIHDIGKIYVPAEILNRPGKLTEHEFALIRTHPDVGYDIVKDIHFPWPVAEMVRQHHERLDGSGYPLGLKDGEIILEARILSVADVLEAMASHRPYRASLGMDAAIEEIEKGRGRLFDSGVVDACLRVISRREIAFPLKPL